MKLVDGWRSAWRWASVRASALGVVLVTVAEVAQQGLLGLPDDVRAHIPNGDSISLVLFVAIPLLRIITFREKKDGE
jgi:hypothetical protein